MESTAAFIAILTGIFFSLAVAVCLPLWMSGKRWKAAQEKAHARRLADAKMNARLLRFNL